MRVGEANGSEFYELRDFDIRLESAPSQLASGDVGEIFHFHRLVQSATASGLRLVDPIGSSTPRVWLILVWTMTAA